MDRVLPNLQELFAVRCLSEDLLVSLQGSNVQVIRCEVWQDACLYVMPVLPAACAAELTACPHCRPVAADVVSYKVCVIADSALLAGP